MPASGEIIQMTFQQKQQNQIMETVLHFRELTSGQTPDALRLAAETYLGLLSLIQTGFVAYPAVIIKKMTPLPFDEDIYAPVTTVIGAVPTQSPNMTIACVVTKRTGTAGKTHRGRIYLGGLQDNTFDPNFLTLAARTNIRNWADGVMAAFGPSGSNTAVQLGLYSRHIGGSSPFTVAGWQPVTRLDVQPVAGTQRRRRVGVGI